MEHEELIQRASILQRQSEEIEMNLRFINQQISELDEFKEGLQFLETHKGKEMISSLGRGIFLKSSRTEDKFFVEVGAGIVVKKSAGEIREIIGGQVKKFREAKSGLMAELESYAIEFRRMVGALQGMKGKS